jgi:hypothetical protein
MRSQIRCPHCSAFSTLRLIDSSSQEKSVFVCDACGEASGPIDIALDQLYARRPAHRRDVSRGDLTQVRVATARYTESGASKGISDATQYALERELSVG